jgi:hypothetical protein
MSDIQLFKIIGGTVTELAGQSVAVEKSLQALMERNLVKGDGVSLVVY